MAAIIFEPEHALVGAVAIGSYLLSTYLGVRVSMARRKHGVKYPTMYDDSKPLFNVVQRGHQNYLENQPSFLVLLALGGIYYPVYAAGAGAVYLVSRIAYANGYATGDPAKRSQGNFGYLGLFILLGLSVHALLKIGRML